MDEKKPTVSTAKKRNLKKTLASMLAIVLVAVVSIFATLAYLGTNSNDETNTFLGSAGIDLELEEENWTKKPTPGPTALPDATPGLSEEERAKDYTPGGVYLKNPTLTNKSEGTTEGLPQEWVAMKVRFEIGTKNKDYDADDSEDNPVNVDATQSTWGVFNEIADIIYTKDGTDLKQFNTDDWLLVATSSTPNGVVDGTGVSLQSGDTWAIYIYKTPLDREATTNPLFDKVQMKEQSVFETIPTSEPYIHKDANGKTVYALPAFNINVIGAAIKVEETNKGTAWANCADQSNVMKELLGLLENK